MVKFSWLQLTRALIIIAAWLLENKAKREAHAAGVADALGKALKDAQGAIDKAKAARDSAIGEFDANPERLRDPDEFTRNEDSDKGS